MSDETEQPYEFVYDGVRYQITANRTVKLWIEADNEAGAPAGWAYATHQESTPALCHEMRRLLAELEARAKLAEFCRMITKEG